jgi:hypothetical protein
VTIPHNRAFVVRAQHDGVDTASYRLTFNGTEASSLPVSALTAGVVSFNHSGLLAGEYQVVVTAVGPGGEALSVPLAVTVIVPPPAPPTNVDLVVA